MSPKKFQEMVREVPSNTLTALVAVAFRTEVKAQLERERRVSQMADCLVSTVSRFDAALSALDEVISASNRTEAP